MEEQRTNALLELHQHLSDLLARKVMDRNAQCPTATAAIDAIVYALSDIEIALSAAGQEYPAFSSEAYQEARNKQPDLTRHLQQPD